MCYLRFYMKKLISPIRPNKWSIPLVDLLHFESDESGEWKKNSEGLWEIDRKIIFEDHIVTKLDKEVQTFYLMTAKEAGCGYNYSHIIRDGKYCLAGHLFFRMKPEQ